MISDTFVGYKFRRTYIGGTAKTENENFEKIQVIENGEINFEKSDLLEYRRMMIYYHNDIIHILLSWKKVALIVGFILLGVSVLFVKFPIIFFSLVILSIGSIITHFYLSHRVKVNYGCCDMAIAILAPFIKKYTGLVLEW
jgi:hypothetical protein